MNRLKKLPLIALYCGGEKNPSGLIVQHCTASRAFQPKIKHVQTWSCGNYGKLVWLNDWHIKEQTVYTVTGSC